jgi:hypothetical protein
MRIGFLYALSILLVALKVDGSLACGWAWTLAPIWVPSVAGYGLAAVASVSALAIGAIARLVARRKAASAPTGPDAPAGADEDPVVFSLQPHAASA